MSRSELRSCVRTLTEINKNCGGMHTKPKSEEPQVDTSNMSEYERGQYELAVNIKKSRELISTLEDSKGVTQAQQIGTVNKLRKVLAEVKRDHQNLRETAKREGRLNEYEQLSKHVRKTEDTFQKLRGGGSAAAEGYGTMSGSRKGKERTTIEEMDPHRPTVSIADDPEFGDWMVQVRKKDQQIDAALDIVQIGVQNIKRHALGIKEELSIQDAHLRDIELMTDKTREDIDNLNKKMADITQRVKGDKCCMYIVCFLLLLGIIGGIYAAIKV